MSIPADTPADSPVDGLAQNLARVEERIHSACLRAGRSRDSLRLMAVSKHQPPELLKEAVRLGLRLFGESRVQETMARHEVFPASAEVHLIGHLQRNKARDAARLYQAVQSLDAVRTVEALSARLHEEGRQISAFLEVNTSGEEAKAGVRSYDELLQVALAVEASSSLTLQGLMTIAPYTSREESLRRAFSRLRNDRDRLEGELGRSLPELSMGMSGDLEWAILEGSTIVRVGTALFGSRLP
ncbi:hypothetical protein AU468_02040 [Alkalispirochaeta sphaeroplastigenens]|uniref:Pyridoxal phosphate homeostasis protein n=1 Tax=Alkalispirochaeta sphaeroplastigenens TaxID=1187066 RepID=A0A2S4K0J4_9SPIO|nr:YggS family pyridoxal phosphate-dependent enzyme [Alkalispirochaeta sphaeroplastigenens]POR05292.1 hypothetical protein AU468_02040 [Alkalispirochaeta sphaeroplastigenens]